MLSRVQLVVTPLTAGYQAPPSMGFSKQEYQKNIYLCFIDYAKAFDCVDYNKLWKFLKEMGIPNHLTCLLRDLYTCQEATVRTGHGKQTGSKLRKEFVKALYYHSAYLTYSEYII